MSLNQPVVDLQLLFVCCVNRFILINLLHVHNGMETVLFKLNCSAHEHGQIQRITGIRSVGVG